MATFLGATTAQAAGAGATQAAMLTAQTSAFGAAGATATASALGTVAAPSTLTIASLLPSAAATANVATGISTLALIRQGQSQIIVGLPVVFCHF